MLVQCSFTTFSILTFDSRILVVEPVQIPECSELADTLVEVRSKSSRECVRTRYANTRNSGLLAMCEFLQ